MFDNLIRSYGYIFIFFGTFIESEGVLIAAAALARKGTLSIEGVLIVGYLSSFISDQLYFYIGRTNLFQKIMRREWFQKQYRRIRPHVQKHKTFIVLIFRWIVGFRTITPMILAADGYSSKKYLLYNILGGVPWAMGMVALGWALGEGAERIVGRAHYYELVVFALVVVIAVALRCLPSLYHRRSLPKCRD